MILGLLKEPPFETRVSLLPEGVAALTQKGIRVLVESGAGIASSATDADYEKASAAITSSDEVVASSDVILSIYPPEAKLKNSCIKNSNRASTRCYIIRSF